MTGLRNDHRPATDRSAAARHHAVQIARRHYGALIDAWNSAGWVEDARRCAELAVEQGIWESPLRRPQDLVPGLRADPLPDPAGFWFTALLEERFPEIQAEVEGVLTSARDPLRPTAQDGWLTDAGTWHQAHLFREGRWQEHTATLFPATRRILGDIPEVTSLSPGVIMLSRLTPGTHIAPHCGSTNAVYRLHLAVRTSPEAWIRVGEQRVSWRTGRCLIFDDSFEHEVFHGGGEDRIVLIMDLPHPDLPPEARGRLIQHQLTPEERMVAFMRERGLSGVDRAGDRVVLHPDPPTRALITDYMAANGIRGARLDDAGVSWVREA